MSHMVTQSEHPLPAVLIHWMHLASFLALAVTGILIHGHYAGVSMQAVRQVHFVVMYVFVLTTIVRVWWAFLGRGSSTAGSTAIVRDYKHFAITGSDIRALPSWVGYYLFLRKTRPYTEKYNPLQKLTYTVLFPLGVVVMALTGAAMFPPAAAAMRWLTDLLGGLNAVRLWHYMAMWVLLVFTLIHVYLVFAEDVVQAPLMLFRKLTGDPVSRAKSPEAS